MPVRTVVVLATALWLGFSAAPAAAHVELRESEPAAGARLTAPPTEVYLRFDGEIQEDSVAIRVVGPDDRDITRGRTQSGGRAAAVELAELTQPGVYRVRFEGVAGDGHDLQGQFRFRLAPQAGPGAGDTGDTGDTADDVAGAASPLPVEEITPPVDDPSPAGDEDPLATTTGPPIGWLAVGAVVIGLGIGLLRARGRREP
ncbi:MAG TPA: copper resistance CopC family protein [Egibacteraceae bacterium]|nr:copper resistance CopC family protein [Egibacteraceae bacterium]